MARSNQKSVIKLQKQFASLFGHKPKERSQVQEKLTKAVHSVNSEIYFISLTPFMNNCFNVYMMYKTAQKVITVDLLSVKVDVDAWLSDVQLSAKGFVERVDEVTMPSLSKELTIDAFVEADLSCAMRKLKRMKAKASTQPKDISTQEILVRRLRREIWDFEDELKSHFGKESLASALKPFESSFPIGCRSALEFKNAA